MCCSSKINFLPSNHCKHLSFTYFLLQKQQSEVEESYKNRVSCGSANLSSEIDDHQRVSQDFDQLYERMKSNGDFPGNSRKFLTSLPRFYLVSLTFHENSNHGQENY